MSTSLSAAGYAVMVGVARAAGLGLFAEASPTLMWAIFSAHGAALSAMACCAAALIPTGRCANAVGFGAVLAGFVLVAIGGATHGDLIYFVQACGRGAFQHLLLPPHASFLAARS